MRTVISFVSFQCKPELKVPGLYVVDSIVRQSRHQFGVDKDVFGPRFLKNFTETFQNLYRCPEDDKVLCVSSNLYKYNKCFKKNLIDFSPPPPLFQTKIVRVLNLWQKNGVFDMDILQPLMDMANGVIAPRPAVEGSGTGSGTLGSVFNYLRVNYVVIREGGIPKNLAIPVQLSISLINSITY